LKNDRVKKKLKKTREIKIIEEIVIRDGKKFKITKKIKEIKIEKKVNKKVLERRVRK
jgi:hypothetical protein